MSSNGQLGPSFRRVVLCHLGLAELRLRVPMSLLEIEPERRLELGLETSLWETDLDREDIGLDDGG